MCLFIWCSSFVLPHPLIYKILKLCMTCDKVGWRDGGLNYAGMVPWGTPARFFQRAGLCCFFRGLFFFRYIILICLWIARLNNCLASLYIIKFLLFCAWCDLILCLFIDLCVCNCMYIIQVVINFLFCSWNSWVDRPHDTST